MPNLDNELKIPSRDNTKPEHFELRKALLILLFYTYVLILLLVFVEWHSR